VPRYQFAHPLRRQDLDELTQLRVYHAPAHAHMAVQAHALLGGDEDLAQAGLTQLDSVKSITR
jgi:hypothetical protein